MTKRTTKSQKPRWRSHKRGTPPAQALVAARRAKRAELNAEMAIDPVSGMRFEVKVNKTTGKPYRDFTAGGQVDDRFDIDPKTGEIVQVHAKATGAMDGPVSDWPADFLAQYQPSEPARVERTDDGEIIYSAWLKAKLSKPIEDYAADSDELFDELTALARAERQ